MFIPPSRIREEMQIEQGSAWFVPVGNERRPYLLIKLPTFSLKRLVATGELEFHFGLYEAAGHSVFIQGFIVGDSDEHPTVVVGLVRHEEELGSIRDVALAGKAVIVLFDELARPVARGEAVLDAGAANEIVGKVPQSVYTGESNDMTARVLDDFEFRLDPALGKQEGAAPLWLSSVKLSCGSFQITDIYGLGVYGAHQFSLLDDDEGGGLEQSLWQLLENVYGADLHRSPTLVRGSCSRELTDVLAAHPMGACLFESKALAGVRSVTTSARRTSNVRKDIVKGLRQLSGAIRGVRNEGKVCDADGEEIECVVDRELLPQAIVLLSEMDPGLDWRWVAEQIVEYSTETGVFFHVMDLHELRVLMGVAFTPKHLLVNLSRRYDVIRQAGHAYARARMPPED